MRTKAFYFLAVSVFVADDNEGSVEVNNVLSGKCDIGIAEYEHGALFHRSWSALPNFPHCGKTPLSVVVDAAAVADIGAYY